MFEELGVHAATPLMAWLPTLARCAIRTTSARSSISDTGSPLIVVG